MEADRARLYLEVEGGAPLVKGGGYSYLEITSIDRKFICRGLYWLQFGRLFLPVNYLRSLD